MYMMYLRNMVCKKLAFLSIVTISARTFHLISYFYLFFFLRRDSTFDDESWKCKGTIDFNNKGN